MPIDDLDLTVRAGNCLASANVRTVADLVRMQEPDLLKVRAFGKTSLREVHRKLESLGLGLGMAVPDHLADSEASAPEMTEGLQ